MKVTIKEYTIIQGNEVPVKLVGEVRGDFNVLNPMFFAQIRPLDREGLPYSFEYELDGKTTLYYNNLSTTDFETFRKHLTNW